MYENFVYCGTCTDCLVTQPANQLGNLAFVWAAWLLGRRMGFARLAACTALVFFASTTWHQWPANATLALDVTAASLLAALLTRISLMDHHGLRPGNALAATAGLLVAALALAAFWNPLPLHGIMVLPGVAYLLFTGLRLGNARLLLAGFCLGLGLAFRSLDMALCPYIPFGTHIFWHTLSAIASVLAASTFHRSAAAFKLL